MIMDARTTETEVESTVSRAEYDAVVAENAELRKKLDFIMGQVAKIGIPAPSARSLSTTFTH